MRPATIPVATYRLQFHAGFTFDAAREVVPYLRELGISHAYASSYFKAVPGSTHGYDVADPTQLNPEVGDRAAYDAWVAALRQHGMGHIIDLVPNHMGIAQSANPWWQDVLENGPSSRFASVFDIDWHPLKQELENKVLLPVLGDTYGAVLERGELRLEFRDGAFEVRYFQHTLPVAPGTYDRILGLHGDALVQAIGPHTEDALEFQSIITAIKHLPGRAVQDADLVIERDREKEVIKRRIAALASRSDGVRAHIEAAVSAFNGSLGDPRSFDRLDDLLSAQAYRAAYWRVAAEEINYRRFFDINELAAIRMEDPAVFDRVHALAFELLKEQAIDGLRIDHVDGLFDPGDYLQRLQARAREVRPDLFSEATPLYVVVEKILGAGEALPDWPVQGTSGYDFLVMLNGLFVDQRNDRAMKDVYEQFTRVKVPYREIAYRGKQLILRVSMASELNVLAHRLNRFSERSRHYRDFTLNSLTQAMREIIACFPVYRTYVNPREQEVSARDRDYINRAVREAKRRNPNRPAAVYDFIADLLLKRADYIVQEEVDAHLHFVGKFQQVTSPITAKGIEDTALYIYNRLLSLNEVGGEPDHFGVAAERLHAWLGDRMQRWPHALSATSTHDTKRSEDVRARLNVLSELPGAWKQGAARWARMNRRARTLIDEQSYPSRNEEYLLYQTLLGSWPCEPLNADEEAGYRQRIVTYMQKAMREAKLFTSWINPSERHEAAMTRFVEAVLDPGNAEFREDFVAFQRRIAGYGIYNSLAQLTLKLVAPGVPDFYQGSELWDFSLVDPDNRRPVDYERRRAMLVSVHAAAVTDRLALVASLTSNMRDDRTKLYCATTLLQARQRHADLFASGNYVAVQAEGARKDHLFACARRAGERELIAAVPRLPATLLPDAAELPLGERVWGDTRLLIGSNDSRPRDYVNLLTGQCVSAVDEGAGPFLRASEVLLHFPVALLEAR